MTQHQKIEIKKNKKITGPNSPQSKYFRILIVQNNYKKSPWLLDVSIFLFSFYDLTTVKEHPKKGLTLISNNFLF